MKKLWDQFVILASLIWFPALLIAVFLLLAFRITGYSDPETVKVALGIMLGVALGFVADILKRSLDEFQKQNNLRRTALALLKTDAENIFRSFEGIKDARDHKDSAPKEVREMLETSLPPQLELRYWKRLNQDNDFLLLGSSEPFKEIFSDLWEIEKINQQIEQALKQDKRAYMFAMAMYNTSLEQRFHEVLLSRFMDYKELEEFKKSWRTIKKKK